MLATLLATLLVVAVAAIAWVPTGSVAVASTASPRAAVAAPPANSVVPFGGASLGVNALTDPNRPVVGMAATPDGGGYWLVASDGGIFTFGDASFYGSTGNIALNRPVVGMAATADGKGYWLVASDGGIFTFGDATFNGSTGNIHLNRPMVGMAATPDGHGYWLVASDGGIFTFGDAAFHGSTGNIALNRPVVGMAATPDGRGYWLVASDGGIFTFGDAQFFGSEGGSQPAAPIVGMAATPSGNGYWMVLGSPTSLVGKVVGIDPGHNGLNYSAPQVINQPVWNGQESESCDTTGTATAGGYTEAQFNFNVATYLQSDLEAEGAQVVMTRTNNSGVGPCVTTRAAILNNAHADVAVDIHADGGPPNGRGFAVLEPVADGPNNGVIGSSANLASVLRDTFQSDTGMPLSTYDGVDGLQPRNDLAGLNLTTVPKVLIECGNMQNGTDAALLMSPAFQQSAAAAMAQAITTYLNG
jgi:N-acetylmuramoyl-L-alanine amidase